MHHSIKRILKFNNMKNILIFSVIFGLVLSCNQSTNKTYSETPTRGDIKIGVDESFRLLLDTELFTFSASYPYAKITPVYKNEYDVINDFVNDSVRTIVTAAKLTKNQEDYLKSKTIIPKTHTIAIDAVAFIVNVDNPDSLIQIAKIKQVISGNITNWKDLNPKNKNGQIEIVFDNNKSANTRYFIEKLNLKKLPDNCFNASTNDSVIGYVEKNKNAIGIISVNWISENSDSVSNKFLKRVRVVGLTSELDPEGTRYYRPYPAYIADKSYPFIREVYMINRETFEGLGSGFISFVAGERGQRIVLKAGLVPSTMPVRLVEMKSN